MSNPFRTKLIEVKKPPFLNLEQSGGKTSLLKGDFQSPNFATGEKGWKVDSDGKAEFTDLQVSGFIKTVSVGQDIQSAIDYLNAHGGGEVRLDTGTHTLTDDITLYSGISLVGAGRDNTILEFSGSANGILVLGTSKTVPITNFTLKDFTLQNSNNVAGIDIQHARFWRMENIRVTSCDQIGFRIRGHSTDFYIRDCRSDNNTGDGFEFSSTGSSNDVEKFSVINCVSDINGGKGFELTGTPTSGIQNYVFIGCLSQTNDGIGLDITVTSLASIRASFISCVVDQNTGVGLNITFSQDISFIGLISVDGSSSGINLTSCKNITFKACQSYNNNGYGIELISGNDSIIFDSNTILGNSSDGLRLTATSDRNIISNSNIINNGGYGLNIFASTCDSNLNNGCMFGENISGAVNNSGTGTLIRSNMGVADN